MSLNASDIHLTKSSSMAEIVGALQGCRQDARVVQEACDSLRDQLEEDAKVYRRRSPDARIQPHAIPMIVLAMKQHQNMEKVQTCACQVLANFAAHHPTIPSMLVDYEAFPEIVVAMERHVDSTPVQEQACSVILNATSWSGDTTQACIAAIVEAGCLPQIVAAMARHPDSAIVEEQACRSLLHMILEGERTTIVESGAVPYFVVAIQKHPDNFDMNEIVSQALNDLAENNHLDTVVQSKAALVVALASAIHKFDIDDAKELLDKIQPDLGS